MQQLIAAINLFSINRLKLWLIAVRFYGSSCSDALKAFLFGFSGDDASEDFFYQDKDDFVALCGVLYDGQNPQWFLGKMKALGIDKAFALLRGAFVILVKFEGEIFLLRDQAGEKTVYYTELDKSVYISSEQKVFRSIDAFEAKLNPASVLRYFTYSYLPAQDCMMAGVHELLPGHYISLTSDKLEQKAYYSLIETYRPESVLSLGEYQQRFEELFDKSLERRLGASQSFGCYLSGGLDSSIVAARLKELGHHFPSWTIHFGKDYPNEIDFAKELCDDLKLEHHLFELKPKNFIPNLREAIWYMDEPVGDPITVPNYELAKEVSKSKYFVFNGEGGDPLFGGPKNFPLMLDHWYHRDRPENYRAKAYLESYRRAYDEIPGLFNPDFIKDQNIDFELEKPFMPYLESENFQTYLNRLMAANMHLKGSHLILPKIERMLGANSLIPQSPLFDVDLMNFSLAIPPKLKLAGGDEKLILKQAFQGRIPQSIIDRPKSGMRVPVYYWFKKDMKRFIRKILSKKAVEQAGIFHYPRLKELMNYSLEERQPRFGMKLWMVLTFEIWRRLYIEGEKL